MKIVASFFASACLNLLTAATLNFGVAVAAPELPRAISVRGEGELKVAPDLAIVSLSVQARAKDAKSAQRMVAEEMARVTKVLRGEFGIEGKEIQSYGVSVNPDYRYDRDGKRSLLGFQAGHSLSVRMKKIEKAGELLDRLPNGKAGDERTVVIQGVSFDTEKRRDFETEALGLAMANAQARASALAGFAKKNIKGVLRISDSSVNYRPYELAMGGAAKVMTMAADAAPATELNTGEIIVTSSVAVDYEMD